MKTTQDGELDGKLPQISLSLSLFLLLVEQVDFIATIAIANRHHHVTY